MPRRGQSRASRLATLDHADAACLVDVSPFAVAGIDVGHARASATADRRIEIGVEDAASPGELKLGPVAFAHPEARLAEARRKRGRVESDERAALWPLGDDGDRCGNGGWIGTAARKQEQGGGGQDQTHVGLVPPPCGAGKLVEPRAGR